MFISLFVVFQILRATYYKEQLGIYVQKLSAPVLERGDRLLVVDVEDFMTIGEFQVDEIRPHEYYAIAIDRAQFAVWIGYIKEQGKHETTPPPHTVAVFIPKGSTQ